MTSKAKLDHGMMQIDDEECKGCGLCVEACPANVLHLSDRLNRYGYRSALYNGSGCSGCGICFMACPEPGAITVFRLAPRTGDQPRPMKGARACASN